jgi:membrane protein
MRALISRVTAWVNATFEPLLVRLVEVGVVQAAVVLAAQTFMALFPLLIAVIAIVPPGVGGQVGATLRERLGVSGDTDESVRRLISTRSQLRGTLSVFGVLLVLASATSFTRALQRVYQAAWRLPRLGLKGNLRGLVWLVGVVAYFGLVAAAIRLAGGAGPVASPLRWAVTVASSLLVWWWTPFLLLGGRVTARALLPGALLTGTALLILGRVSQLYLPRAMRSQETRYGAIGAVFALESWLVVLAGAVVIGAVLGAVGAQYPGPVGRLLRGSTDPDGWQRAPHPLRRRAAEPVSTDTPATGPPA